MKQNDTKDGSDKVRGEPGVFKTETGTRKTETEKKIQLYSILFRSLDIVLGAERPRGMLCRSADVWSSFVDIFPH